MLRGLGTRAMGGSGFGCLCARHRNGIKQVACARRFREWALRGDDVGGGLLVGGALVCVCVCVSVCVCVCVCLCVCLCVSVSYYARTAQAWLHQRRTPHLTVGETLELILARSVKACEEG